MSIKTFFQSQLYINFWKFMLMGALVLGTLCMVAFSLGFVVEPQATNFLFTLLLAFIYGGVCGFLASALGFWIVYGLARTQMISSFLLLNQLVAVLLAGLVVSIFSVNTETIKFGFWFLAFPGIPFFGGLYFFNRYSVKYIKSQLP